MTPLQVSVLWGTARPGGVDVNGSVPGRQMNWLIKRRLVRKRLGRYVATREGKKMVLYQTEGWHTIPDTARQELIDSLKRLRPAMRRALHTQWRSGLCGA